MKFTEEELEKIKKERMEQIDRWLDSEYGCSYTRLEELHDFVIEQDMKHQEEKDKEIERLNNNWNELRKWIVNNKHNENTEKRYLVVDYGTLLGKMRELEGEDKE